MANAQELYASLVKNEISPKLRAEGLVGSGGRYSLKSSTHWALIGFQKSKWNDKLQVEFTINLMAVSREGWANLIATAPYFGAEPNPESSATPAVSKRITKLMVPEPSSQWWKIESGKSTEQVSKDVIEALTKYGIPWLRAELGETD